MKRELINLKNKLFNLGLIKESNYINYIINRKLKFASTNYKKFTYNNEGMSRNPFWFMDINKKFIKQNPTADVKYFNYNKFIDDGSFLKDKPSDQDIQNENVMIKIIWRDLSSAEQSSYIKIFKEAVDELKVNLGYDKFNRLQQIFNMAASSNVIDLTTYTKLEPLVGHIHQEIDTTVKPSVNTTPKPPTPLTSTNTSTDEICENINFGIKYKETISWSKDCTTAAYYGEFCSDENSEIIKMQKELNRLSYNEKLTEDGYFGNKTLKAIEQVFDTVEGVDCEEEELKLYLEYKDSDDQNKMIERRNDILNNINMGIVGIGFIMNALKYIRSNTVYLLGVESKGRKKKKSTTKPSSPDILSSSKTPPAKDTLSYDDISGI